MGNCFYFVEGQFLTKRNSKEQWQERCLNSVSNGSTKLPASKNGNFPIILVDPHSQCRNQYTCNTKDNNLLEDCKNRMKHGGRYCTMTAIVPHPRLQGVETLANVLCNKAT